MNGGFHGEQCETKLLKMASIFIIFQVYILIIRTVPDHPGICSSLGVCRSHPLPAPKRCCAPPSSPMGWRRWRRWRLTVATLPLFRLTWSHRKLHRETNIWIWNDFFLPKVDFNCHLCRPPQWTGPILNAWRWEWLKPTWGEAMFLSFPWLKKVSIESISCRQHINALPFMRWKNDTTVAWNNICADTWGPRNS